MNDNLTNVRTSRRAARQLRRAERRAFRVGGQWASGAVLILIGLLLLLSQATGIAAFESWWALFILLPAIAAFGAAWRFSRADGLSKRARSAAIIGTVLTLVTATFLFNLNWSYLGPAVLILGGLGLVANGMLPD